MNIIDLLKDSIFQSTVLSPIFGIIWGFIFSLGNSPSQDSPVTIRETTRTIIIREPNPSPRSNNLDPLTLGFGILIVLTFLGWGYITHSHTIFRYFSLVLSFVFSFYLTTNLIAFLNGHFNDYSWYKYTLSPIIILIFCLYIFYLAQNAISPEIRNIVKFNSFMDFFWKYATKYEGILIITQMIGFLFMLLSVIKVSIGELHYLALMNLRGVGRFSNLWEQIAIYTYSFVDKNYKMTFVPLLFLVLSYLCFKGHLALWFMKLLVNQ